MKNDQSAQVAVHLDLSLPSALASEASALGLLEAEAITGMLEKAVREARIDDLFATADRLAALREPPLTAAELEAEIAAARTERRALRASSR